MQAFLQDLQAALRGLARARGFTLSVVTILALGCATLVAVFAFIEGTLLRPLPFQAPDRIVRILSYSTQSGPSAPMSLSPGDFLDLTQRARSIEVASAFYGTRVIVREAGEAKRWAACVATPELFEVLGTAAAQGRGLGASDVSQGRGADVVVVSDRFWRAALEADPAVVGRTLMVDGRARTVVGIMPPRFAFPASEDLWLPFEVTAQMAPRDARFLPVVARLRPQVSLEQANAELSAISGALSRNEPRTNAGIVSRASLLSEAFAGSVRPQALLLTAVAVLLLLIVCFNITHLMLARASSREREWALRASLGATPQRLVQLVLAESLLLAVLGGTAGAALGAWGLQRALTSWPGDRPFWFEVRFDLPVLLFTAGLILLTGLVLAFAPSWIAAGARSMRTLKDGGSTMSEGPRGRRFRLTLVAGEIAASVVLLSTAGLLARSFERLGASRAQLEPTGVVVSRLAIPKSVYPGDEGRRAFLQRLLPLLSALPGVEQVAASAALPFDETTNFRTLRAERGGDPRTAPGREAQMVPVSPGSFRALGLPVRQGRDLQASDRQGSDPVAVINESAARQLFGSQSPLGRRMFFGSANDPVVWTTVVGVVPDVLPSVSLTRVRAAFYVPWDQQSWWDSEVWLVVRMRPGASYPVQAFRDVLAANAAEATLTETRTLQSYLDSRIAVPRLLAAGMLLFSGMAFVIALLGLYSIVAYSAVRRTRELGIRMALGAEPRMLGRWAMAEPGMAALVGTVAGLTLSALSGPRLRDLLFEVGPHDPFTLAWVSVFTMGCALLAAWSPIRRALKVSPLIALRHE